MNLCIWRVQNGYLKPHITHYKCYDVRNFPVKNQLWNNCKLLAQYPNSALCMLQNKNGDKTMSSKVVKMQVKYWETNVLPILAWTFPCCQPRACQSFHNITARALSKLDTCLCGMLPAFKIFLSCRQSHPTRMFHQSPKPQYTARSFELS